ncbi:MAG: hypothetical protein ACI9K2_005911 [Myxococcota bacterium]|jgi:hypothetical protein
MVWVMWVAIALAEPEPVHPLDAMVAAGRVLLDDRADPSERAAAARTLAAAGDPEAVWLLRAVVADREPEVQLAAMEAAIALNATGPCERVATDRLSRMEERRAAVDLLGGLHTDPAGRVLWSLASDRRVPARLRSSASAALDAHHPALLAELGRPRTVIDPLGGVSWVTATGVVGGITLSSVGVWGQFDGAEVIGAVGGGAVGLGAGGLYVARKPVTSGQGLAWSSGIGWGLASGLWTTSAVHGPWRWIGTDDTERQQQARDFGAAYRAVGVVGGAAVGGVWAAQEPDPWDVLEVDLAGYLGSAIVLAGTGLVAWPAEPEPRPEPCCTNDTTIESTTGDVPARTKPDGGGNRAAYLSWEADNRRAGQVLAASTMVGAAAGLGAGVALQERWDLDWNDAAFATVVGLEAAWIGGWTPLAVGVDDTYLKGTVRLPWNVAVAGGLALSEAFPMSVRRTALTATGAVAGNALGAGIPLLAAADEQAMAASMLPVGLAGTVAGNLAEPWLAPTPGTWTMTGIGTVIATSQTGLWSAWDASRGGGLGPEQASGLTLTAGGVAVPTLLIVGRSAEPRADQMWVVGAGAAWGGYYGALIPVGIGQEGAGTFLGAAIGSELGVIGTSLALTPGVGLEPRQTLVPQLGGLAGGTVGALGTAMFSTEGSAVALGAVVGAALGTTAGGVAVAVTGDKAPAKQARLRLPGVWAPLVAPSRGPTGASTWTVGLRGDGW